MQENQNNYLEDGVKKWAFLGKHVFYRGRNIVKAHFGGKIPPKHNVSHILNVAMQDNSNSASLPADGQSFLKQAKSSRSTRPTSAKSTLEDHGIMFPDAIDQASTCRQDGKSEKLASPPSLLYQCAPSTKT